MRRGSRLVRFVALVACISAGAVVLSACGGDDDGGGATGTATNGKITVEARDVEFNYKTIDAPPGELTVDLVEKGSLDHTFVVEDQDGKEVGEKLAVDPGSESDSGTFDLQAGDYTYFCDIPGHRGQGMEGTLVVK
jgi:plastocyanin